MKKQLYLYLFLLTALFLIFTYTYYSKALEKEKLSHQKTTSLLKSEQQSCTDKMYDANYFSLLNNQRSQDYFEQYDFKELNTKITNDLLAFNDLETGNPYTGQEIVDSKKFIINKIKILNHRWIIADYSNGDLWGDVVIKYFVNQDKSIDFKVVETIIYPKETY
jgi:hypothetical protein